MNEGIELPLPSVAGGELTWVSLSAIEVVFPIEDEGHLPSFRIALRGRKDFVGMAINPRLSRAEQLIIMKNLRAKLIAALQGETKP